MSLLLLFDLNLMSQREYFIWKLNQQTWTHKDSDTHTCTHRNKCVSAAALPASRCCFSLILAILMGSWLCLKGKPLAENELEARHLVSSLTSDFSAETLFPYYTLVLLCICLCSLVYAEIRALNLWQWWWPSFAPSSSSTSRPALSHRSPRRRFPLIPKGSHRALRKVVHLLYTQRLSLKMCGFRSV